MNEIEALKELLALTMAQRDAALEERAAALAALSTLRGRISNAGRAVRAAVGYYAHNPKPFAVLTLTEEDK